MNNLLVKQIGIFINEKIKIFDEFKEGLLNIDKFGHIIVFYISDTINQYSLSNININVAQIINVSQCEIEIISFHIPENSIIIDIKPYFPVEDRVKNCSIHESFSQLPEFFGKYNDDLPKINSKSQIIPDISFCGIIKKENGICYLKFDNIFEDYLSYYEKFSHLYVIWWFDKFEKDFYRKTLQCNPPYENAPKTGIFASRSPVRINPVALTLAKIINVDKKNKTIQISLTDAFDNTPFIDVKPYIPYYFKVNNFSVPKWINHWSEWFEEITLPVIDNDIVLHNSDFDKIKNYFSVSNNLNTEKIIFENNDEKSDDYISIVNACENNLKNVCIKIPKNKITTITGLSGSGKSTLAFDVIYSESQRRFMDTFSNSEKQSFKQFEKPNVEKIINLPPATAIEQSKLHKNSLSTIATYSDLSDYIKILFAKIGIRHCPKCKKGIEPKKRFEIENIIANIPKNCLYKIISLKDNKIIKDFNDSKENIKEEIENILEKEDGAIKIILINNEEYIFHERNKCYYCGISFFELTKSNFTYNNPECICLNCNGSGVQKDVLSELIISNPEKSILDNASQWWGNLRTFIDNPSGNWMKGEVIGLAKNMNVDIEKPWNELPDDFKQKALYGTKDEIVSLKFKSSNGREGEINRVVEGAINHIKRLYKNSFGKNTNEFYNQFMSEKKCSVCMGEKLSFESRIVTVFNKRFPEVMNMTIIELYNWVENLSQNISKNDFEMSKEIIYNILKKCKTLIDVGVEYLQLNRSVSTISGGEAQRLKLASRLNCGLTNLLYILDEPTIGLHKSDKVKIINILKKLRDSGNTIIVVEHNKDMILNSDYIIDMGPKAGIHGGEIIAKGNISEIINNKNSITGKYLIQSPNLVKTRQCLVSENIVVETCHGKSLQRKNNVIFESKFAVISPTDKQLKIYGAVKNNLKNISVSFPLNKFICVTGKSGSGKSSLITQTLVPVLTYYCNHKILLKNDYEKIEGLEHIDKIISVTQESIGKTPRSNPATYTGVFDEIRELFAQTKEAKAKKYSSNKFSFNTKEGYCNNCKGEGKIKIEMNFTADIWIKCSQCEGKRYNENALSVKYKGKTIADILEIDIDEAIEFFEDNKKIYKILKTMQNVGLGYLKLGQSALTLSGGEAQRIKLAKELSKNQSNKTLYILDEPTTGLHFEDTKHLINLLKDIISKGNSVIVIEHNEEIINCADFVIELGPEGGENGGYLITH